MIDKIKLSPEHEPTKEELLRGGAEKPVRRLFTIDIHGLDEDGPVIDGYPDFELRNSDLRMRITIPDGMSRGELLFYLRKLREEIRDDLGWNGLTVDLWINRPDTPSDNPSGREREETA